MDLIFKNFLKLGFTVFYALEAHKGMYSDFIPIVIVVFWRMFVFSRRIWGF